MGKIQWQISRKNYFNAYSDLCKSYEEQGVQILVIGV